MSDPKKYPASSRLNMSKKSQVMQRLMKTKHWPGDDWEVIDMQYEPYNEEFSFRLAKVEYCVVTVTASEIGEGRDVEAS